MLTVTFGEEKMMKRRGHFCRICKSQLPNEAFSGKGHAQHVCRQCACMPKDARGAIEHEDEIFNFLKQSHISGKNRERRDLLRKLADTGLILAHHQ